MCTRCVMDTTAPDIVFDENGVCNFCTEFFNRHKNFLNETNEQKEQKLNELVTEIKKSSKGKKYDCIVGVSGGVDSSYTLYKVVKLGLKPLAVHMDNGWNSELAQYNIQNLVQKLNVDLYTYVIDWEEYKALQQAFFDADVVDIELLYDNAANAVCYKLAKKNNLKFILAGSNNSTEGVRMPNHWNWNKYDKINILSIFKKFNQTIKIKSFPIISSFDNLINDKLYNIKWVAFLDYLDYIKSDALKILIAEVDYKPYPYKHYESVFTRFYQGYILPKKFNIDKRKVHFTSLILTNQMDRSDAIRILKNIPYSNKSEEEKDIDYFLKKMNWSNKELDEYLTRKPKSHLDYKSELNSNIYNIQKKIIKKIKQFFIK